MQNMASQSLCTFSEEVGVTSGCGQVMAEGRVSHRADIQPPSSDVYMKLKGYVYIQKGGHAPHSSAHKPTVPYMTCRYQFRAAEKTKNTAQQLEKTPLYRPRAQQREYVSPALYLANLYLFLLYENTSDTSTSRPSHHVWAIIINCSLIATVTVGRIYEEEEGGWEKG